jgi:hypothetical protein
MRNHLLAKHAQDWITSCDKLGIPIKANAAHLAAEEIRGNTSPALPYSRENFVDAIVEFIVGDDQVLSLYCFHGSVSYFMQSINVIESPRLRKLFRTLKADLKESDIPGRTTISNRIKEMYDEYLEELEEQMKV